MYNNKPEIVWCTFTTPTPAVTSSKEYTAFIVQILLVAHDKQHNSGRASTLIPILRKIQSSHP